VRLWSYSRQIAIKKSTFTIELMGGSTEKLCTDISSTLIFVQSKRIPLVAAILAAKTQVFQWPAATDVTIIYRPFPVLARDVHHLKATSWYYRNLVGDHS
jgi:hypothetical protein